MKLENSLTGYIQPIDKDVDLRDVQINNLTNSIDKPYINISNSNLLTHFKIYLSSIDL